MRRATLLSIMTFLLVCVLSRDVLAAGPRDCTTFSGANAGAKIAACIADLPSSGGIADARGFEGAQTISVDLGSGVTKPVQLIFGAATYSVAVNNTLGSNFTLDFSQGGSLSIATGTTTTIKGTLLAPLTKIFTLNGSGVVSFTANNTIRELYPQWWGAVGDGPTTDDTAAIQAAIDALPAVTSNFGHTDFTQSNALACVVLPSPATYYKTTAPLNITKSGTCLRGASGPVRIENADSVENVINVDAGSDTILFGVRIENLQLKGAGTSSRALYLDQVSRSYFRIWAVGHVGTAVYMESTGSLFTGSTFNTVILDAEANVTGGSIGLFSKGGRSNIFEARARELEIGVDLENEIGSTIRGSYIESNIAGTAKTGIRIRNTQTGAGAGASKPRHTLSVVDTYFENNTNYSIDADSGSYVMLRNIRGGPGITGTAPSFATTGTMKLDGGGSIDGMWFGTRVISSSSIVTARDAWGVWGRADQLHIRNAVFPLAPGGTNSATKSWMDTAPTWTAAGANTPTLAHDTTTGFYGANSEKVSFPSVAVTFADSRVRLETMSVSSAANDVVSAIIAAKFSDGDGKGWIWRLLDQTTATIADVPFSPLASDLGQWMIWTLQGKSITGTTEAQFWLSPTGTGTVGSAVDVNVGAVAIANNGEPVLYNTEWAGRGNHDVDFQVGRFRTVNVNTGVAQGSGLKHGRVSTGSISGGGSAAITLTWSGAAFSDTSYTVSCLVEQATASTSTLRLHHMQSKSTTSVVARVVNDGASAKTGTLHCSAAHD